MLSQWQIISSAPPLFGGPVAFFASYFWSAGFERFRQPPALVLGGFAGGAPTLLKVPKCEIFHLFDFNDFYGIKSL